MATFDLSENGNEDQSRNELQWNKMWELWADEKADSPYAELMTYQSEINNGGHIQFFDNVAGSSDPEAVVSTLYTVLSGALKENLEEAYKAYLEYGEEDDETLEEVLEECDSVFYDNQGEIEELLREYAKTIEI